MNTDRVPATAPGYVPPTSAPEPPRRGRRSHGSRLAAVSAVTAAAALGAWLIGDGLHAPKPPPQPTVAQGFPVPTASPTTASPAARAASAKNKAILSRPPITLGLPPSAPTRVRIPATHVDAPVTGLRLQSNRQLEAPPDRDPNLAGWFKDGTTPGSLGTAVIAGHVDNWQGPAVFYNLGALDRGAVVDVDRADGSTAEFTVDAVEAYDARDYPSAKIYGWTGHPELRIITCGAGYDKRRQEYLGNVVVYAHLTSSLHTRH